MIKLRERERGRVEGNIYIYIYIKLRKLILIGSKGEENFIRFESGKFKALVYKEVLKSIYCIGDNREKGIETRILYWRP